ncbi:MAG: dTDP-glucose 4,6-dehydratase [Burkholderiaceae bacterium]|nr:dTDP-glucose 4,6-dehydratase [Burkholderiaceae bacterium]
MILVTGGCGFIGARFVVEWLESSDEPLLNLDALTYAARPAALSTCATDARYRFVRGDVCDAPLVAALLAEHRPRAIVHLAAETHVDRSIADAAAFGRTNALGTLVLLQAAHSHLAGLSAEEAARFRFLHCSTDEVFGSLAVDDEPCDENAPYRPRNPYAASKAAADHFVAAFHVTHAVPTLVTRGSNTYGPGQHPEKLVALAIERLLADEPVPLYGDGLAVRDWLYVSDHVAALRTVLERGRPGESYNVAGHQSVTNRELIERLIEAVDVEREAHAACSRDGGAVNNATVGASCVGLAGTERNAFGERIRFVADRPGHDRRYALDDRKLRAETGWSPQVSLGEGLRATVRTRLAPIDLGIENPP